MVALLFAALAGVGGVEAAPPPEGYVVVRLAVPGVQAQASAAASLEDRGYRLMPVPPGMSAEEYVASLRGLPGVVSAERDAPVVAAGTPNDPFYASNQASYMNQVGAPTAWDLATGRDTVVVAVLDSGTDLTHEELQGRLWENTAEIANDGLDNDGNGCIDDRYGCRFINVTPQRASSCGYTAGPPRGLVLDDNGRAGSISHSHGTIVAGIIGAAGNNGIGITGMAWNVRIMTVKVLDCGLPTNGGLPGGDMTNVAQGIDYARRMGAQVINLSLASRPGDASADLAVLREAIQAAQDQGIAIVAASGNGRTSDTNRSPGYPAAYTQYPAVIGVGASDNLNGNGWAPYSNYGPSIDLAAPGNEIVSITRTDLGLPGGPYGIAERGTSYSTPIVTGAVALMLARNSRLGVTDIVQLLKDTATPAPPAPHGEPWAGAGIVNAGAAVARVPLTITGTALQDWKDVAPGTVVRALIDGNECGTTTAFLFGAVSRYTLRVRSAAEQPGCGLPGKSVRLFVGGLPATPEFSWAGPGSELALPNREVNAISPPPGGLVVQTLNDGWSLVAHYGEPGALPEAVSDLPPGWTDILRWALPGARWLRYTPGAPGWANSLTTLERYDVYWVRGKPGNVATLNPNPAPGRSVALHPGWNAFVYTGTPRQADDALEDVAGSYTAVMRYDNAAQAWRRHTPGQQRFLNDFEALLPLRIYWVYMTAPGTLLME